MPNFKTSLHGALHRLGFDIVPYSGRYFPARKRIEIMKHEAHTVIDVGANEGQFVEQLRRGGWHGPIASLEPLPAAFAVLASKARSDPMWTTMNVAAGASTGTATLNVANNNVSSSLLEMANRHAKAAPDSGYIGGVDVAVDTLDSILANTTLDAPYYLKIDTQGYELEVLRGAAQTLARCIAVELELSIAELYVGQPLLPEVMRWLMAHMFVPIRLWPSFVADNGDVLQCDALFIPARR